MAEAAGLILSALGTGLSLISLLQGNLKPADHGDTQVKLTVACADVNPADNADSVSGNVDLRIFTRYGEEAGPPSVDNYINGGNTAYEIDYNLSDEYHGNQNPYVKVTGNNDAICIAWMTMTWSDGTDWVWDGQNGRSCGVLPWHYNDAVLGNIKQADGSDGGAHRPDCSWIDGDGSVGGDTTAFSYYMPHYTTENDGSHGNKGQLCSSPNLATYQNDDGGGLTYFSPPPAINNQNNYDGRKKRDSIPALETRNPANANGSVPTSSLIQNVIPTKRLFTPVDRNTKLIQSPRKQHSAVELCESDMSWGASFISTYEGKFCDMSTKTVYDLCKINGLLGNAACFDLDTLGLKSLRSAISYNWEKFEKWGDEEGTSEMKVVKL